MGSNLAVFQLNNYWKNFDFSNIGSKQSLTYIESNLWRDVADDEGESRVGVIAHGPSGERDGHSVRVLTTLR